MKFIYEAGQPVFARPALLTGRHIVVLSPTLNIMINFFYR